MARPAPLRRLAAGTIVAALLAAGCTVAAPSPDGSDSSLTATTDPGATSTVGPTATVLLGSSNEPASPGVSPSGPPSEPSVGAGATDAVALAATGLLAEPSARFELQSTRFEPGEAPERAAAGSGVVDPSGDRGRMRFELLPDEPEGSPLSLGAFDVVWNPTDFWTTAGDDAAAPTWSHTTRAAAPGMALIGRVNEEPLALIRLAASGDWPVTALPPVEHDGRTAERWLVSVPAAEASDGYVPPETYLAFEQVFGRSDLPLEVWLVDGEIVRVGYVLERDETPGGGPDRIETWYDWSDVGEPIDLVIPPEGRIVEVD